MTDAPRPDRQRGFLGFVERAGNLLPDPTIIFVYLIFALMLISALGAALGWQASLPYSGEKAPQFADAQLLPSLHTVRLSAVESYGAGK